MKFLISTDIFRENINLICDGGAQPNIGTNQIGNFFFPFPHLKEQELIAKYLEEEEIFFNRSIQKIEKSIELLKEFKSSLISHVVTGKIKI